MLEFFVSNFEFWLFDIVSDFEFRASNFVFQESSFEL